MAKRSYTDEDRARIHAYLTANDGNVLRTAKDTGVPQQTVRLWKKKWETEGLPAKVEAALPAVSGDITTTMSTIRDEALDRIRVLIPEATVKNLSDLNRIFGTLQDKLDRMNGLANKTVEVQHTVTHQTTEQQAALLQALADNTLGAYDERRDIIDAEVVEEQPKGLPPAAD